MSKTEAPRGGILQRDGETWAIVPRTPVGVITPDVIEALNAVVKKYAIPIVKITSGQRIALPEIRTRQDADAAARAIAAARTARARKVTLTTFLLPALAPGRPVTLADMPDAMRLGGMRVDSVLHSLPAAGPALSTARGPGGEAGGAGGLLAAAAGALA